jgi:putative ATP-binding cassette transporter
MKEKRRSEILKLISLKTLIGYSFLTIISGLAGFGIITLVNKLIAISVKSGLPNEHNYLLMFVLVIAVFFITRRLLSEGIINISQELYWGIRRDIIVSLIDAPYRKVVEYKDEVYSTLTVDVNNITNASLLIIDFISSIILIVSILFYMFYLSPQLLVVSLGVIGLGIVFYVISLKYGNKRFLLVRNLEQIFMMRFNYILNGAKEINIAPEKGQAIYKDELIHIMNKGKENNIIAFVQFLNSQLISRFLFYGLITFTLLYSGKYFELSIDIIISYVFVLLYLLNPIVNVMTVMPEISRASVSLQKMSRLKNELQNIIVKDKEGKGKKGNKENVNYYNFENIVLTDYSFSFGTDKFSVGPIDLEIIRNKAIFIYGGNGAGKTTFINTILRLYDLDSGSVTINGELIPKENLNQVKNMFSPIFSDFYLFDAFYGIPNPDLEKAAYYIKYFEIEDKVSIVDGKFSTIDLSTGQRKRLALINAILEDKPLIVLDEWAADQDPHFRHKFYTEIIPYIIEKEDKTIIAITHDDRYFSQADYLYKMEYGVLKQSEEVLESTLFLEPNIN